MRMQNRNNQFLQNESTDLSGSTLGEKNELNEKVIFEDFLLN